MFRQDPPLEIENFLSPEECKLLIEYYHRSPKRLSKDTFRRVNYKRLFSEFINKSKKKSLKKTMKEQSDLFWDNRTVPSDDINSDKIRTLVESLHYRIICATCGYYNEEYLYPDFSNVVYWGPDKVLTPHCDNMHINDPELEHNTAQRDYSAVLCLNEDYEGGHTIFPEHGKEYPGKTGRLIIFPSGRSHPHGVTEVTSGSRYTFSMWMTKDNNYIYKVNRSKSQLLLVNEGGISLTKTWRWVIFFRRRFISFQFISPFFYIGKR